MIKNIFIKNLISKTVFSLLSTLNIHLKHDNKFILLYSNMGFRDNIYALYEYLRDNEYNKKYVIVCSTNDYKKFKDKSSYNIIFTSNIKGIFYFLKSAHVYYCFGKLPIKPAPKQDVIQMWHGTPLKAGDKATKSIDPQKDVYYTHLFSASKHFIPIISTFFNNFPKNKIVVCGHPRTDILLKQCQVNYDFGNYKKLIAWIPTFRKSQILGYQDCTTESIIPLFSIEDFTKLNDFLKKLEIKIVIKLHPLQDLSKYKLCELSHLILLSHQEFTEKNMDLYKLLKLCDGLITDYSSVYYDYLLLNRPIAFTADDEEEYGSHRGYAMENPKDYKPGPIIKNQKDFYSFIADFSNNIDNYKEKRELVKQLSNDYCNGDNCKRALEISNIFI